MKRRGKRSYCPRCVVRATLSLPSSSALVDMAGAPSAEEISPHFPDFEIVELIGAGAMGLVYLARQIKLDRLVALKLLPADEAVLHAEWVERFEREARSLARINHTDFVQVFDQGKVAGWFFIVLEYVDGPDLSRVIRNQGPLSPARAIALFTRLCRSLDEAHKLGIVHRDLKPANLLLSRDESSLKVADFGLAKHIDHPDFAFTLTQDQAALGTPYYMAPEQREGSGKVDQRADIYSLGVVFYEMLTGELPSAGHFKPPSQLAAVSARYDAVILKALEPDPTDRYADLSEMLAALERARQPRKLPPFVIPLAILLLGVVTLLGIQAATSSDNDQKVEAVEPSTPPGFDWSEAIMVPSPHPDEGGFFGWYSDSVGELLVVSAPGKGLFSPQSDVPGRVYLMRFDGEQKPTILSSLQAPVPAKKDHFGLALDLSPDGSTMLVSSRLLRDQQPSTSVVYVYERTGEDLGNWDLSQTLTFEEEFGAADTPVRAFCNNQWLVVGSPDLPPGKSVQIYHRPAGEWVYHSTLAPSSELSKTCQFGFVAKFDGDDLYLSAFRENRNGNVRSGALLLFGLDEQKQWKELQLITAGNPGSFSWFGLDWGLTGENQLAVGAWGVDTGRGKVSIFSRERATVPWDYQEELQSANPKAKAFGQQLNGDGQGMLAALAFHDAKGLNNMAEDLDSFGTIYATEGGTVHQVLTFKPPHKESWLGRLVFTESHLIVPSPDWRSGETNHSGKIYLIPKASLRH